MKREDRIKFIKANCEKLKDTDLSELSDGEIYRLYFEIPLSPEKEKKRDRELYKTAGIILVALSLPFLLYYLLYALNII